jgi:hypothetical protein
MSFVALDEEWLRGQTLADFMGSALVLHDQAETPTRICPACLIPRSDYEGHWCTDNAWKRWT